MHIKRGIYLGRRYRIRKRAQQTFIPTSLVGGLRILRTVRVARVIPVVSGCIALLVGLWLGRYPLQEAIYFYGLMSVVCVFCIGLNRRMFWSVVVIGVMCAVGIFRGHSVTIARAEIASRVDSEVTIEAVILDDPRQDAQRSVMSVGQVELEGTSIRGVVRVTYLTSQEDLERGDRVLLTGKLNQSLYEPIDARLFATEVVRVSREDSILAKFRRQFVSTIDHALPAHQGALAKGYLLGGSAGLSDQQTEEIGIVGLGHIVAVSGYNLTIMIELVRRSRLASSAYQTVIVSVLAIVVFVVLAGMSASLSRALVVTLISLGCWYYGRRMQAVAVLGLSSAISAYYRPEYLWGDWGWYLSFAAFAGILLLSPLLSYIARIQSTHSIRRLVVESVAAQLMITPLALVLFSGVSIISPVANVLIGPLVPVVMILSVIGGLCGMLLPFIGEVILVSAGALVELQLWVIHMIATAPGAYTELSISPYSATVLYLCMALSMVYLQHRKNTVVRERHESATINSSQQRK